MTDKHASWENFRLYMEKQKQSKPVLVPMRIEKRMRELALVAEERKVSPSAAIAFTVILEYIMADLLENAGIIAETDGTLEIEMKHIFKAIHRDPELATIYAIPDTFNAGQSRLASKKKAAVKKKKE